jgi:hypothetical protein
LALFIALIGEIFATIRSARKSRRVIAEIGALLQAHGFSGVARIAVIDSQPKD